MKKQANETHHLVANFQTGTGNEAIYFLTSKYCSGTEIKHQNGQKLNTSKFGVSITWNFCFEEGTSFSLP